MRLQNRCIEIRKNFFNTWAQPGVSGRHLVRVFVFILLRVFSYAFSISCFSVRFQCSSFRVRSFICVFSVCLSVCVFTKYKTYVCLYICFNTKPIHLEVVTDLTFESFPASLRRFICRRDKPHSIYSDNATNFSKANKELQQLQEFITTNNS